MLRAAVAAAVALIPAPTRAAIALSQHASACTGAAHSASGEDYRQAAGEDSGKVVPRLRAAHRPRRPRRNRAALASFSAGASTAGAASMLALQVFVEGDNLGAMNL